MGRSRLSRPAHFYVRSFAAKHSHTTYVLRTATIHYRHHLLPRYWCARDRGQQMVRSCITFAGTRVDQVVAIEVLEALRPLGVQAALDALDRTQIRPMKSGVHWSSPFRRRAMKAAASNGCIRQRNRRTVWLLPNWKSDGTTSSANNCWHWAMTWSSSGIILVPQ